MPLQAVIFDLDGVLLSTDGLHYQAWKRMADREGIYFDERINERLRAVSRMASLDIVLERASRPYTEAEKEAPAAYKNDLYRASPATLTPGDVFPGVWPFLSYLRSLGLRLAIGSSSKNTKAILARVGLAEAFRGAVSDGTNIARSKPDPEVFLKAAQMVRADPPSCLVLEDAAAGVEAAKAGGMLAMGLGSAARHPRADFSAPSIGALMQGREGPFAPFFEFLRSQAPAAAAAPTPGP